MRVRAPPARQPRHKRAYDLRPGAPAQRYGGRERGRGRAVQRRAVPACRNAGSERFPRTEMAIVNDSFTGRVLVRYLTCGFSELGRTRPQRSFISRVLVRRDRRRLQKCRITHGRHRGRGQVHGRHRERNRTHGQRRVRSQTRGQYRRNEARHREAGARRRRGLPGC